MADVILQAKNLVKRFPAGRSGSFVNAVNGVDLTIRRGEVLGMVGESGSGKSTIGRTILRLTHPTKGQISFDGKDITKLEDKAVRLLRKDMQMVFQDPWSALNPRMKIGDLIAEPLRIHLNMSRSECRDRTEMLARRVRLSTDFLNRTPSALSGGQLQRVCIARAIATNPKLIVLDEPTSSLDLSVRAGILELLQELRAKTEAGFLFISHDLGTIKLISDRIAVLYLGRIVEEVPKDKLFSEPSHPYSQSLLSAHLPSDPNVPLQRMALKGEIPSPINPPSGCSFHTRCPVALAECKRIQPLPEKISAGHLASCLRLKDGKNIIPRVQK
jgi:oligopeptide/dipeptide ABC transporter ATP-binding protein